MKIREEEFYLLSIIEKDILSEENLRELIKLDNYFTMLDAYLSLGYSVF